MTTYNSRAKSISLFDASIFLELLRLMKPRVMSLVIFTCAVGLLTSNVNVDLFTSIIGIFMVAIGAGAAGAYAARIPLMKAAGKTLKTVASPLGAVGFAGWTIADNLREGKSLPDSVVDKWVGVEMLFPETATCGKNILEERFVEYLKDVDKRIKVIEYAWEKLNENEQHLLNIF